MKAFLIFSISFVLTSASRNGQHNMQVLPSMDIVYLSLVPSFQTPNDFQLLTIAQLTSQSFENVGLILDNFCITSWQQNCLFTLVPENFDLDELIAMTYTSFSGGLYFGNPELTPPLKLCDVKVEVQSIVLVNQLTSNQPESIQGTQYIYLPISQSEGFLAHVITENVATEFDSLMKVSILSGQDSMSLNVAKVIQFDRENESTRRIQEDEFVGIPILIDNDDVHEGENLEEQVLSSGSNEITIQIKLEYACLLAPEFRTPCE